MNSQKDRVFFTCAPPGTPIYFNESEMPEAVAAEIEEGPFRGLWMFSNHQRAEEFCWKRGLIPDFEKYASIDEEGS